jgi:putative addiction module component (TIGR02574 family)
MPIEADLVQRTMHLSQSDRAELARQLIVSLETDPLDVNVDQAWEAEIARRITAYDQGEMTSVDARDAIARIRASLRSEEARE